MWTPRHLSVSSVELYARCPAAWRRRYVHGVLDPPTAPLLFGRVFHQALEALHKGEDAEVAFLRAYCADVQPLGLRGVPPLQHGLALLEAYRQRGVEVGEPEVKFQLPFPDASAGLPPLLGYIDLMAETSLWEFKTSSASWDQGRVDTSAQSAVYHWAFTRLRGRRPEAVRFLVFSTRTVSLQEFVTYPSGEEMRLFEVRAAAVWRGILAGQFPPQCKECEACRELLPNARGLTLKL